jgi:hypothetical protein
LVANHQFFDFFAAMMSAAALIPWAMICLSYFFFSNNRDIRRQMIPKATSPLQPFLAIWGFGWSIFIGLFFEVRGTNVFTVITSGFEAWTRGYEFWSTSDESWGFSMSPYAVVIVFVLLLVGSYFVIGRDFIFPDAGNGPLRGVSPVLPKPAKPTSKLGQIGSAILNAI